MKLTVEHLSLPKVGETKNGDAVLVRTDADGASLVAVIDALGHGELAAAAADLAIASLERAPLDRGLRYVIDQLHVDLRGSRGAAAMLTLFRDGRFEGCGIGNVDLRSMKTRIPIVLSPGILGASVSRIRVFDAQLTPGDRLLIFSDGISARIDSESCRTGTPAEVCRAVMDRHRRTHDDATILITDIEA